MRWMALTLPLLLILTAVTPAAARSAQHEVYGVAGGDMLKMRAGIGTGYRVLLGLPNGTRVTILKCEASGSVQWCKVALSEFRSVSGWVSMSYLRETR